MKSRWGGPGVCLPTTGDNTDATTDSLAPGCAFYTEGNNGIPEIWFQFTVPSTGLAIIETSAVEGSEFIDTGIAAYSGSCEDLTLVGCDDDGSEAPGNYSLIELSDLTPGETIYIALWEYGGNAFGETDICVYQPIPCDDIGDFQLDGCGADFVGLNWTSLSTGATFFIEYGESGFTQGDGTVVSGTVGIDGPPYSVSGLTAGTDYDFYLFEDCGSGVTTDTISTTASTSTIELTNDDCSTAISIPVGGPNDCTPTIGANNCASDSDVDHVCAFYQGGDVWFSFVAPAGGEVWVETAGVEGSFTDGGLAVYGGNCDSLFTMEGWCDDDDGIGAFSLVILTDLVPGETYYAAVWEYGNDAFGEFSICAYEPPTCPTPGQFSIFTQNIGPEQVEITWADDILPGAEFVIEYGEDGFTPGTGMTVTGTIGVDGPPVLISGLTPETVYDYYWQGACSDQPGDSTNVLGPNGFTTTAACPTPFEFQIEVDSAGFDFITVSWPPTVPGATFVIEYGPEGYTQGSGTTITGTVGVDGPPVTITDLEQASNYDMYLLQLCPPDDQTDLVGPILIETLSPPPG